MRRKVGVVGFLALAGCCGLGASAQVPAQDARNVNLPGTDTHMALPEFHSLQVWEKRKAFLREQILNSAGLSPLPVRNPLHAEIFGKIEEKILGTTYSHNNIGVCVNLLPANP